MRLRPYVAGKGPMRAWSVLTIVGHVIALAVFAPGLTADSADGVPYGISTRVPWTTSRVTGSPDPPPPYRTQRVWPALTFTEPVEMVSMPGTDRLVVAELGGRVYQFRDDRSTETRELLLDLGTLPSFWRTFGISFHPRFAENRYVYLCYARAENDPQGTRVSRFQVSVEEPWTIDLQSETLIIDWYSGGHNGGCLRFGPDGCLYITSGDGSEPSPPDERDTGQDISDLLASVLRIDVDHTDAGRLYSVPADNPFREFQNARPEVWAYGLRNPWKISFDSVTGDLWAGDVGWEMWEMVFRIERGGNYGWSLVEGPQPVRNEARPGPTPVLPPVVSHSHTESRSVTGGFVYRGSRLPELVGAYIYGDYVTGKIWALRMENGKLASVQELVDASIQVIAFAEDRRCEIYIVGYDGSIHELVAGRDVAANREFPRRLSETGLFASVRDRVPAAGVISYSVNAEPWEDGAHAERLLAVPGSPKLGVHTTHNVQAGIIHGTWAYPTDTVFAKTLSLPVATNGETAWHPVETQLLHLDGDTWRAYAYAWNDEGTDASLVPAEGLSRVYTVADPQHSGSVHEQTWEIAGRTECLVCHTTRAGSIHGFKPAQLNREHHFGTITDNQLRTYAHIGLIDPPARSARPIPSPWDENADLHSRARAYLHINCAHCHLPGGGGTADFELRYDDPLLQPALVSDRPAQGTFEIPAARVINTAHPYHSLLLYRMAKLGRGRMPRAGSGMVDEKGIRLIRNWIQQLTPLQQTTGTLQFLETRQTALIHELALEPDTTATESAIDQLLVNTTGALRLVFAIDDGRLSSTIRTAAIVRGSTHANTEVRDLFERFLPENQRIRRLGAVVQVAELLSRSGDADRGWNLFFNTEGVQCRVCHRIGQAGEQLGPDLSQIGKKFNRAALLESILEPSKKIDPKYVSYLVETTQGLVHSGLLVSRTETEIILRDAQNKLVQIPGSDVESISPQQASLMPELLLRDLTQQQVADLLEYLGTLR